jgi:hypothetical protein
MISVWPKFYHTTDHYKEFDSKGWMFQRATKDSVRDWIGKGYIGSFYDAYNPDARKLFWAQMKEHIYSKGFDAWWMDASEPDILSNASIEYRKQLMTPTALGPSTKYFNAYALMNAEAIYNGQRGEDPNKRVFLLGRYESADFGRTEFCHRRNSLLDNGYWRILCGEPLCAGQRRFRRLGRMARAEQPLVPVWGVLSVVPQSRSVSVPRGVQHCS